MAISIEIFDAKFPTKPPIATLHDVNKLQINKFPNY